MNTLHRQTDTSIIVLKAKSFPEGIKDAFRELSGLIEYDQTRDMYGLSRGSANGIEYYAGAAETRPGEGKEKGLETMVVPAGNYYAIRIEDYMQNMQAFGPAFQQLLAQPNIDTSSFCVEHYLDMKSVDCLVRIRE